MRHNGVHRQGGGRLVSRSLAALIAGVAAAAGALALGALSASASTDVPVAATATKAVTLEGASLLGALPASTPLTVSVVLNVPNQTALTTMATDVSTPGSADFGQFLTPSAVASEFSPSAATASAVAAWLESAGLSAVSVEPDRLFVDATGDAAAIEQTFGTTLDLYSVAGQDVYENTSAALVPDRFAGEVSAVLGLSDMPMTLPHVVRAGPPSLTTLDTQQIAKETTATSTPDLSGFTPQQLATVYSASSLPEATRTSVAVVVSGDMTSTIADLREAEAQNHAAQAPVSVVYTAPEADVVTDNPNTGNLEWDLDTQMSTQIAGDVSHEYLYDIPTLDDADVARAINMFVEQDKAVAGSASLGECDVQPFLDGSMVATDEVLEEGALQGQSFFASSGDNGYACPEIASTGVPGGVPGTSWPASGTWTTGVGGTTLLASSAGQYMEELSWIGGGGGISNFETPGPWTSVANPVSTAVPYLPAGGRGVPDIAADADGNVSPVIVWQDGASNLVGGTSVASPLAMGIWARLQSAHSNDLGVAAIDFYTLYNAINSTGTVPSDPAAFHDVTLGSNGVYTALPGYDFTTGIGSFDASVLNTELAKG
jgi:pseudomonalisin